MCRRHGGTAICYTTNVYTLKSTYAQIVKNDSSLQALMSDNTIEI